MEPRTENRQSCQFLPTTVICESSTGWEPPPACRNSPTLGPFPCLAFKHLMPEAHLSRFRSALTKRLIVLPKQRRDAVRNKNNRATTDQSRHVNWQTQVKYLYIQTSIQCKTLSVIFFFSSLSSPVRFLFRIDQGHSPFSEGSRVATCTSSVYSLVKCLSYCFGSA